MREKTDSAQVPEGERPPAVSLDLGCLYLFWWVVALPCCELILHAVAGIRDGDALLNAFHGLPMLVPLALLTAVIGLLPLAGIALLCAKGDAVLRRRDDYSDCGAWLKLTILGDLAILGLLAVLIGWEELTRLDRSPMPCSLPAVLLATFVAACIMRMIAVRRNPDEPAADGRRYRLLAGYLASGIALSAVAGLLVLRIDWVPGQWETASLALSSPQCRLHLRQDRSGFVYGTPSDILTMPGEPPRNDIKRRSLTWKQDGTRVLFVTTLRSRSESSDRAPRTAFFAVGELSSDRQTMTLQTLGVRHGTFRLRWIGDAGMWSLV